MKTSTLTKPPALPLGAPGRPPNERYRERYGLILVVDDEAAQMALFNRLVNEGFKPRVVVT